MKILNEITKIRFFDGDKKKRQQYMKKFKGRWDSDSQFIRSAIIQFQRQLDTELRLNKLKYTPIGEYYKKHGVTHVSALRIL